MRMTSKSSTITEEHRVTQSTHPIHPGEILLEDFLRTMGIAADRLAEDTTVAAADIDQLLEGRRSITADLALRLSRFFGTSDMFWLNLQARHDLELEKKRLGKRLEAEVHPFAASPAPTPTAPATSSRSTRSAYTKRAK
jgi:addiction module HigA family antidote